MWANEDTEVTIYLVNDTSSFYTYTYPTAANVDGRWCSSNEMTMTWTVSSSRLLNVQPAIVLQRVQ